MNIPPSRARLLVFMVCMLAMMPSPVLCGTGSVSSSKDVQEIIERVSGPAVSSRGLFVSLIQSPPTLSSREAIKAMIDFAGKARIKVLFVQIYRANKTWFPSQVGDPAPYEAAFKVLGEDPFALLIREAHTAGLEVHAWLNMLSLSDNEEAPLLKKYGPEILTRNLDEKKVLADYKIDSQYFLEPGDTRVRAELVAMVGEIVRRYTELDGIQFDYIRYPDSHPRYGYTPVNMERFKKTIGVRRIKEGGRAWSDWKRAQVTELLRLCIQKARDIRPKLKVSSTGCMSYERALFEAFQDWPSWLNQGLVDFVTVMNYSPDPEQYKRWNEVAKTKIADPKRLYLGVGAYKLVHSPEIFAKEFRICEEAKIGLCAVFHYGNLLENPELAKSLLPEEVPPASRADDPEPLLSKNVDAFPASRQPQ